MPWAVGKNVHAGVAVPPAPVRVPSQCELRYAGGCAQISWRYLKAEENPEKPQSGYRLEAVPQIGSLTSKMKMWKENVVTTELLFTLKGLEML